MISIEQQYAEKLHAYTLPRHHRINTRSKDLVDMVLLARIKSFDLITLREAVRLVFKVRNTHRLPRQIDPPPMEWRDPFNKLVRDCSLSLTLEDAFTEIVGIHNSMRN